MPTRTVKVIGLMHSNGQVTAIDANYAKQLKVTGLSSLDAALRETTIRTALPDTENKSDDDDDSEEKARLQLMVCEI